MNEQVGDLMWDSPHGGECREEISPQNWWHKRVWWTTEMIWLNRLWWTPGCSPWRSWDPQTGECLINAKTTRGQCLPGQHGSPSVGPHLPVGLHWRCGMFVYMLVTLYFCRKDVFACIGLPDGDPSWERSFSRWPFGVCDYLVPVEKQFHPEEWVQRTRNIYNWSEPHGRCRVWNVTSHLL